jgi:hypothetical protein
MALSRERGRTDDPAQVRAVADAYAVSSTFPGRFVEVNRTVHRWVFDQPAPDSHGPLQIDVAPMLRDAFNQQSLRKISAGLPATLYMQLTETDRLRPGEFHTFARWGRPVAVGASVLAGVFALLTLATARGRGKALASVGISALLIGAAGRAAIGIVGGRLNATLNNTSADMHAMAAAIIAQAEASLHHWLDLTFAVGGGLFVLGVVVAVLERRLRGRRASRSASAARTRISVPT